LTAVLIENPQADVARADAVQHLVGQRLAETEMVVVEARAELRGLALLAEVDAGMAVQRDRVRAKLKEAESRLVELMAAQEAARDLGREARARALEARKDEDWAAAVDLLRDAEADAAALDSLLQQAGALCGQIKQRLGQAATRVSPHLRRPEYAIGAPDLDTAVLVRLDRAGGPRLDPMRALTAAPSLVEAVAGHAALVLRHRPATTAEPEGPDHE
jgi:hypothetical protein